MADPTTQPGGVVIPSTVGGRVIPQGKTSGKVIVS